MEGKVLITGSNGQLGQCLKEVIFKNNIKDKYLFSTRKEFDITDKEMMEKYLNEHQDIKIIINCAAYTNVREAETEDGYKLSSLINIESVKNLANLCNKYGIFLIHFGTDYMYNSKDSYNCVPIDEEKIQWKFTDEYFYKYYSTDKNKYGYTKCVGIHEMFKEFKYGTNDKIPKFVVIVVSWLYSEYGKNFVKTIKDRLKLDSYTNVVYTQIGSPTYAMDLAKYVIDVIENDDCQFVKNKFYFNIETTNSSYWHIINFSNLGVASWYDIAKGIENYFSPDTNKIYPSTKVFDNVIRPNYSVLDTKKIRQLKEGKKYIRYWGDALKECCERIKEKESD